MSTVKISQLPEITQINANTANTLFAGVDIPTGATFKMTAHTLAQGLYSNEVLNVGTNPIILPNTVAQYTLSSSNYIQTNLLNSNDGGSADIVVTANTGTDTTYFVDLGYANKDFTPGTEYNSLGTSINPLDAYLYVQGSSSNLPGGNLIIGSTTTGKEVRIISGGGTAANIVAKFTSSGLSLNTQSVLAFGDSTVQTTAGSSVANTILLQAALNATNTNTRIALAGVAAANANIALALGAYGAVNSTAIIANSTAVVANQSLGIAQSTAIVANSSGVVANIALGVLPSMNTNTSIALAGVSAANANIALALGAYGAVNSTAIVANSSGVVANQALGIAQSTAIVANIALGVLPSMNTNTSIALAGVAAANANIALALATNLTQNTDIQSAWNTANTAVQNTATITVNNLKLNGNLTSSGNVTASYLLGNVIGSTIQNTINWLTTTVQPSQQTGQLFFYANTTSLVLDTDISNNRISVSKTIYFRVFNSTGVTIPANSWVRLVPGVTPNTVPYIALADATTSANSTVAGFVVSAIANSAYGIVYQSGLVEEFNSTGLGSGGDILFLSPTPGQASNVAPTGSNTVVQLARIINSDPVLGKIQIAIQLRQAYGRINGSVLYAYANNITSSNTISINDSTQTVTGNNIVANTITISGNTAATSYVNTWTPNVAFSTANGTMTYTAQYGNYVKVGRQVTAYFTLNVTNTGGSGNMFINGLPFAAATGSGSVGLTTTGGVLTGPSAGNLGTISGNVTSGATSTALYTINNTGNGSLTQYPVAAGTGNGGIGSPFTINGMISYISAS